RPAGRRAREAEAGRRQAWALMLRASASGAPGGIGGRDVSLSGMAAPSSRPPVADPGAPFAKLSVFYPMWNEEEYIERALHFGTRACEGLIESGDIADYELIVIDDASTDRTPAIADKLAAEDPHVRVIH